MFDFSALVGQQFHRLTIIGEGERRSGRRTLMCRCLCGTISHVHRYALVSGGTKSCGCLDLENHRKHGMWNTKEYRIWSRMKERCNSANCSTYKYYGGRGIKVCERWSGDDGFENFYTDMGAIPKGKSIDRINNNGDYSPENCRWATIVEQNNNRRYNRILEFRGESKTLAQWSGITGIKPSAIRERLRRGWSVEQALTVPTQSQFSNSESLKSHKVIS